MSKSVAQGRVEPIANSSCALGEGPVWIAEENRLAFVDIIGRRLLFWHAAKELEEVSLNQRVGGFVTTTRGLFLAASERGLFVLNPANGDLLNIGHDRLIGPENLMNDTKCDRQGRLVFGSKALSEAEETGALMSFDGHRVRAWQPGTVLNGPAFSPDGARIYFADSPTRKILTADYNPETGDIGKPEVFVVLPADAGYPDGMSVDCEGCLWNAHWDGWRLSRYSPEGVLLEEIPVPVARPTSIAFGGGDLKTLFITSAKKGRAEDRADEAELAGDLFSVQLNIAGLPETPFRGALDA